MFNNVVIYLDLVIISTLLINFLFIKVCSLLLKIKISIIRLMISLLISVLSIFLYIVPIKYIYNMRYFIGIFIGLVAFQKGGNKLLGISILYILNLSFIGSLIVFKIDNYLLLLVTGFLICFLYSFLYLSKNRLKKESTTYNVLIKDLILVGFLDTGNTSIYKGLPIVFVNNKYYNDFFKYEGKTYISTIKDTIEIDIYKGPSLLMNNKEYYAYYAFSDIKYDILLNNLMEE